MENSREIDDLHPHVAGLCRQFIAKCAEAGLQVIITSTYRDAAAQDALYAQGRSIPGKIVTYARAGKSWHNYRLAFDFAVMKAGKVDWANEAAFRKARRIGISLGLEGLSFELAHLQARGGLTLTQAAKGIEPKFA